MSQKLLAWDGLGVRPGLFRMQGAQAWVDANLGGSFLQGLGHTLTEQGDLAPFARRNPLPLRTEPMVDGWLRQRFEALPGPAMGVVYAAVGLLLMTFSPALVPTSDFAF